MYVLIFSDNSSKYFSSAKNLAIELGASVHLNEVHLTIEDHGLFSAYNRIRRLFALVQHWKNTRASFRGKKVHPYKFILHMHRLSECADISSMLIQNCDYDLKTKGWGCRRISVLDYDIKNQIEKTSWLQFGTMRDGHWIVDKNKIKQTLLKEVKEKGMDVCPFFDELALISAVKALPDKIDLDNPEFNPNYTEHQLKETNILTISGIRSKPTD